MGRYLYYVQSVRRDDGWVITRREAREGQTYHYSYVGVVSDLETATRIVNSLNLEH